MTVVVQLVKRLTERPEIGPLSSWGLRNYQGPADIGIWLELRQKAFARQRVGVGHWTEADFCREFLDKPWFQPERLWFVEQLRQLGTASVIGTATLAMRGNATSACPVVHWLAVLPAWRRRGVGRFLLATLEQQAWDLGFRQISLETHQAWTAALALYEQAGYRGQAIDEPS